MYPHGAYILVGEDIIKTQKVEYTVWKTLIISTERKKAGEEDGVDVG